jgi:hypothetical protein
MQHFAQDIAALMPPYRDMEQSRSDDRLVESIEATRRSVLSFSRLAQAITVATGATEAAHAMYSGFTYLLDLYWLPRGSESGMFFDEAFDLPKFIGYETFVTLFGLLIRENRWQLIGDLLDDDLYVNTQYGGRRGTVGLGYVSQPLKLLDVRKQRIKLTYLTLHGFLLNERHKQGDLAEVMPMEQFVDADYFLYLRGQLQPDRPNQDRGGVEWRPWSSIYLQDVPRYLEAARRVKGAQRLLHPLAVEDISTLRLRFTERVHGLGEIFGTTIWDDPMRRFDPQSIGTVP